MSSNTEDLTERHMGQLIAEIAKFGGADKISASQLARILLPYIRQHDSTLKAEYEEKVRQAERRGAAYTICQLSFKTVMDKRKSVKERWLTAEGEEWAISMVDFAQKNDIRVIGYNQYAAELNTPKNGEQNASDN